MDLRSTTSPLGVALHQMFRLKTTAPSKRAWKLLTTIYEGGGKRFNEAIKRANLQSRVKSRRQRVVRVDVINTKTRVWKISTD